MSEAVEAAAPRIGDAMTAPIGRRALLRRTLAAGLSLPLASTLLAACSSAPPAASTSAPSKTTASPAALGTSAPAPAASAGTGRLLVAIPGDWATLDPALYTNVSEREIFYSIYDPLVDMNENLEIQPRLAKSWDVQDDGKTIVFHLQSGVKFHDGTDFNADAVKFNLERMLDPATGSPQRTNIDAITKVDVVDPLTVRLTLSAPFTPLLGSLTEGPGFMSSPAAIQKAGKGYGQQPVGTGPFVVSEWLKADQIRLKKFDGYWRSGMPKVTDAVWKPIADETVRMANLASGTANVVDDVPAKDRDAARKNANYTYWDATGTRWPMMRLNVAKEPFNNKAFRQAVSYAINRDDIVRAVYFGEAEPALGPISPLYKSYYDQTITQWGFGYDPAKAKAKLAEAGVSGATFTIDVQNNASQQRMGEIIKENLAAIGVTANIQPYESTAFQDRITNKLYQATIGSWTPRPDVDGTMYRHFASDGNVNSMSYSNPQVDQLLKQTRVVPNGQQRVQLYQQVQKLIVDDAPWAFLVFEKQGRAYLKSVSQIPQIPDMMLRLADVSVKA